MAEAVVVMVAVAAVMVAVAVVDISEVVPLAGDAASAEVPVFPGAECQAATRS